MEKRKSDARLQMQPSHRAGRGMELRERRGCVPCVAHAQHELHVVRTRMNDEGATETAATVRHEREGDEERESERIERHEGEKETGSVTILDSQRTRSTSLRTVAEVSARAARGSLVLEEEGTRHEIEQKRERERG